MTSHTGWIKLHRKLTEWEWYSDANTFRVFIHLLFTANIKDKKWRGMTVKRGQVMCGLDQIANELKISNRNVRTALKHLEMTGEVTGTSSNKGRVITITNYEKYQANDRQVTGNRQASDRQVTATKERKEYKEKRERAHAREEDFNNFDLKGSRLPSDWELSEELGDWAMDEYRMSVGEVIEAANMFKDYYLSNATDKAISTDWNGKWRNWIRREVKQTKGYGT